MIRLRLHLRRRRRSIALAGALFLVSLAVAWMHSGPASHQMGDEGAEMPMAASICLAVLQAAGVAALAGGARFIGRRLPRPSPRTVPGGGAHLIASPTLTPAGYARAGPAGLQVFRR